MSNPSTPNISQVCEALLATLADLRRPDKPMDPERGRTIAKVAEVLVDAARVQVEYIKAIDGRGSDFFEPGCLARIAAPETTQDGPRTILAGGMYAQLGERS